MNVSGSVELDILNQKPPRSAYGLGILGLGVPKVWSRGPLGPHSDA